ncbi:MAG: hypothetical protein HOE53_01315 [Candidatus Magasanikbacteria bacterium]|jgi:hypothetical protein|nr:hypothetical protein [Candidatus Magasanikbacteria bacterium]
MKLEKPTLQQIHSRATVRMISYGVLVIALLFAYAGARIWNWQGYSQLHTVMEVVASMLALTVGILALVRYYAKPSNTYLIIGAGFLGTGILDWYHTVVTSQIFASVMSSTPESLIPWSWDASRYFLAIMMLVSIVGWKREQTLGEEAGRMSAKVVFAGVGMSTIMMAVFFALYPLPRAYYPEAFFGRPAEIGAAILFFAALIGYIKKRAWKINVFEHWMIYSLIIAVISQAMFMSASTQLFDAMFASAHLLKIVSYGAALIGLLIAIYYLFLELEEGKNTLIQQNKKLFMAKIALEEAIITAEKSKKNMKRTVNQAKEGKDILERMNAVMTGRELRMIELKEKISELEDVVARRGEKKKPLRKPRAKKKISTPKS